MEIAFDAQGLVPAIIQHARNGQVLMLGYMNAESLAQTQASGLVTFWSRSRQKLWQKGESSGHVLKLVEIRQDCDSDALLVLVDPHGPTCHTGHRSCFYRNAEGHETTIAAPSISFVSDLADVIAQRAAERPSGAYTTKLLDGGVDRIGKKIGEEAAEVIIAAKNNAPDELVWELSDLLYHALVLMQQQGVALDAVYAELRRRHDT